MLKNAKRSFAAVAAAAMLPFLYLEAHGNGFEE